MAEAKRQFWVACEWASYAVPIALGLEPGASEVLGQVNQLMEAYTQQGWEPVEVIPIGGPTPLVLENSGQLTVQRTLILWGLRDYRTAEHQQEFLDVAQEVQEARRLALIESERHAAAEAARQEISDKVEAARKDASILERLGAKLDEK